MATTPKRTVTVSKDVHRRTKALCEARGVSMSELVEALLSLALEAETLQPPPRPRVRHTPDHRIALD